MLGSERAYLPGRSWSGCRIGDSGLSAGFVNIAPDFVEGKGLRNLSDSETL